MALLGDLAKNIIGGGKDDPSPPPAPDFSSYSNYGDPMAMAALGQQNADLVKWEIDLLDVVERLEHYLRGERQDKKTGNWFLPKIRKFDPTTKSYIEVEPKPLCNEEGVYDFSNMLYGRTHKGVILSWNKESDVKRFMKRFDLEIIEKIALNMKRYEIEKSNWTTVRYTVVFNILFSINRSVGGRTTEFLSTTQKRIEQVMQSSAAQRRLPLVGRWLGGN